MILKATILRELHNAKGQTVVLEVTNCRERSNDFPHIDGPLSRLPSEIIFQIISEIMDRTTLLSVYQVKPFNCVNMDAFRSAYTEEVRRGEYTSDNAIDTISEHIKEHQEAALMIFEVTWKGMIREGQLKGAVSFLNRLGHGLDEEDFDTVVTRRTPPHG
ncbi:hypothetical protein VE00_10666 [Pseudogymnoascus sp. WSF 3629]|nr:hypothetical protein VE00_10666 [Pseudogymnoascus sp. WSF 3629]